MLDKGQNIMIGSRSSLPLHIDLQQPKDELHAQKVKSIAISELEKSTRLLGESVAMLQNYMQEDQRSPGTSTRPEAIHDGLTSADTIQPSPVASMGFELYGNACKNGSTGHICNLENITVGKDSQQTIILEGGGSIRARNITTGRGSVQLIGQLSDVTLQKIAQSWNGNIGNK
ncbi:hypothetical protein BKA59DRAFT_450227 [Fusarium tricinctum]|uniref:Uncharacterized protein n=1 Tax=Fusarium tricinctum TaxID=61284 RepID=A0A8K0S675_9HYPO|nr:hypothetical protein BKA59DRAFT_450227 [Fusarium tricinctum]